MTDKIARLNEAERLMSKYKCPCGSGGPMACDEDCPGDITSSQVEEAIKIIIDVIKDMIRNIDNV